MYISTFNKYSRKIDKTTTKFFLNFSTQFNKKFKDYENINYKDRYLKVDIKKNNSIDG